MFRFTLRELLLLTACIGLGVGWLFDHRRQAEAATDARMLARFSSEGVGCNHDLAWFARLQNKYGGKKNVWDHPELLPNSN
jgi:hypothetical protein